MSRNPHARTVRIAAMYNILVVYWYNAPHMRMTTVDHLHSFERYLDHRFYYVNLQDERLPWYVTEVDYDIIIFHDLFFCGRWGGPPLFEKLRKKIDFLKDYPAFKIAVPQDEFISADLLGDFINSFDVHVVFSVSPESEWPKIYREVDRTRVKFYCVLTGYLDEQTQRRIEAITAATRERTIGIGYRAGSRNWRQGAWLGRHGLLKFEVAHVFQREAPQFGIQTDISTRAEDVFMGDDWLRFLARCKYMIGVEGGASILDWDGSTRIRTLTYVEEHPEASMEEIERECFPGMDGKLALYALSPRHLEACATRTCQVLIEGDYNGVLQAGRHYIPVKRDFSNINEVLEIVRQDEARAAIVEAAYQDVVASGRYTYHDFAEFIIAEAEKIRPQLRHQPKGATMRARLQHALYTAGQRVNGKRHLEPVRGLLDRAAAFLARPGCTQGVGRAAATSPQERSV
jgi:hypothetical protein